MARCDKRNWYRERESRRTVLRPKRNLQRAPKNQLSVFNSILSALKCKSVCYLPHTYKVFIYTIHIYTIYLPIYILYICYINVFSINQAESKGTLCGSQANCWQNFKLLSETCLAHLTPAPHLPLPPVRLLDSKSQSRLPHIVANYHHKLVYWDTLAGHLLNSI